MSSPKTRRTQKTNQRILSRETKSIEDVPIPSTTHPHPKPHRPSHLISPDQQSSQLADPSRLKTVMYTIRYLKPQNMKSPNQRKENRQASAQKQGKNHGPLSRHEPIITFALAFMISRSEVPTQRKKKQKKQGRRNPNKRSTTKFSRQK